MVVHATMPLTVTLAYALLATPAVLVKLVSGLISITNLIL